MPTWVYNPHTGGKSIPHAVKARTQRRILDYANKHHSGKFTRIDVRFRGALCYIDVYTEPGVPRGTASPAGETPEQWIERLRNTPTHVCRIRYFGNEDRWSFAWYTYAHEKYEPGFPITEEDQGTPEEAFETSAHFL
jgi:hypothetical protein